MHIHVPTEIEKDKRKHDLTGYTWANVEATSFFIINDYPGMGDRLSREKTDTSAKLGMLA